MKKWLRGICLGTALSCSALEVQPWFGDLLQFHFLSSYAYSRFHSVQGGIPPLTSPFNADCVTFGLEFCPLPDWSVDLDLQVASTSAVSFYFRSTALQARALWLDDLVGDPISLNTGVSARFTPSRALSDISCPSHANVDFEVNFALGKEWDASDSWRWRLWFFGAIGHGNRGSPWVRGILTTETNIQDRHRFALYATGSNGYGRHTHLFIDHFRGYAKIRAKSIDLGVWYGYHMRIWGTFKVGYERRVLAKANPKNVDTFIVSYSLPFSL
jgi:hypothetical protein